jgi:hypothetical protein
MKKKIASLLVGLLAVFTIYGLYCEYFSQNYGTKLNFSGGDLYYTSSVTLSEANRLGQYLVKEKFFDGNRKSIQINKTGSTYEFRMVIKKGLENDQELMQVLKIVASQLSTDVFVGSRVDIHLCDQYLRTIRVVVDYSYGLKKEKEEDTVKKILKDFQDEKGKVIKDFENTAGKR